MGQLEKEGRTRKRKRNLRYAILNAVRLSIVTGVAITAPNIPQALYKLGLLEKVSNDVSTIQRTRRLLIHRGLLLEKKGRFALTFKGMATLQILESQYSIKKPKRWDGRWRVLIFDVPEYRKTIRDKIRRTLMHIGFVRLQDSVWAYPYDCEDLIVLLKADFKIGKDVLYMIVDELEGDKELRKQFGLARSR